MATDSEIYILGNGTNGGCYLLALRLDDSQKLRFGLFNQGQEICLKAGDYLYVGSARGERGASSLSGRLLRHAIRSGDAPPHAVYQRLHHALIDAGLPAKVPGKKTLRWHIDYLLDLPQVEITRVIAVRSRSADERYLAGRLSDMPETIIPARGLGASDDPSGTHLLRVEAGSEWWQYLPQLLRELLDNIG